MSYQLMPYGVIKDGNTFIQNDPANKHWIEFQKWIVAGNIPIPEAPLPPPTQGELDEVAARSDNAITALKAMTPAQARAWVTANVNTLADAKTLLGTMAAILCVLARKL